MVCSLGHVGFIIFYGLTPPGQSIDAGLVELEEERIGVYTTRFGPIDES